MLERWELRRILIVVKTYPTPAWKGGEVVCTAGITEEGQWIRLFPIPFRMLDDGRRFTRYQWIEARIAKATADIRPESHRVDSDSIRPIGAPVGWAERQRYIRPLLAPSLCHLREERNTHGHPTLGIFRPGVITRLRMESVNAEWNPRELARLNQLNLIDSGPIQQLQKIPFTFRYQFRCSDSDCPGHGLSCTDWEMSQSYRSWNRKYGQGWSAQFIKRYFDDMILKNDTQFFVGTVHGHPREWVIIGLYYPPKVGKAARAALQAPLF